MFKRSSGTLGRVDSPATRKRQKTTNTDAVQEEGRELLKAIDRLAEKRTQRAISVEFQRLPSRKLYPDYYQLIKKPIALDIVQDNLEDGEYVTLELMREDLLQMCNNAKRYNQKGSMLYSDAAQIARLVKNWSGDADNYSEDSDFEDSTKEVSARNYRTMLNQTIKGIFSQLKEAKDRSGRKYIDIFLELPDKKLYPDYYTIVTNPMSINTMEIRMKKNPYTKIEKFQEHINQLWENAYIYNDPKSQVAIDAKYLQKLTNKLIDQAKPKIEAQEKELAEQAKSSASLEARTPKPLTKPPESTGSFKIKLGLRQPTATPSAPSPSIPKVKLHLGGHRTPAYASRSSPAASTPVPRKSTTPVSMQKTPSQTPAPSNLAEEVNAEVKAAVLPAGTAQMATRSVTPATPVLSTVPVPATTPAIAQPPVVYEAPILYRNSGTPLILSLSLCASQIPSPTILHIPAVAGQPSLLYSWTQPITSSAMTVSPSLCHSLLEGKRGYALVLVLNGRKVAPMRQANGQTPIKNSIWELRLSAGMNCIECIVEAEDMGKPAGASSLSEPRNDTTNGVVPKAEQKTNGTPQPPHPMTQTPEVVIPLSKVSDDKVRERMSILVFLR